ncbi:MAG TPA: DUF4268 domain-containing protein [Chloroflexia bacterium]|nr:DUF4268 domain-containing protein [Chloroflexia bacterium]
MITSDTDELVKSLEIRPLREAFPKEARHFTTWLGSNIKALSDRIGIELTVVQTEKQVGDFSADILCEDAKGKPVIIENQLEPTDHRHLGQLLTYLVNLDASTAIWVASDPRPEHEKVINWLNEATPADVSFYLVKVEAIRIGVSPYAPLFTVLARPDLVAKEIGEKKKEWAERHFKRFDFWKGLLDRSKGKTKLFSTISPSRDHWISTGAGRSGCSFNYSIYIDGAAVDLYIDSDHSPGGPKNKAIFDKLFEQREAIEKELGEPLEWQRLNDKRACRIVKRFYEGGLTAYDTWPQLQDTMIDAMTRFDKALRPRLAKIEV